jgi:hypothetical protein
LTPMAQRPCQILLISVEPFYSYEIRTCITYEVVRLGKVRLGWMRRVTCVMALSPLHLTTLSHSIVVITDCSS